MHNSKALAPQFTAHGKRLKFLIQTRPEKQDSTDWDIKTDSRCAGRPRQEGRSNFLVLKMSALTLPSEREPFFPRTGRDTVFADLDEWGTIYQVDMDIPNLRSTISILYDGDDAGRQFDHPDFGIRSPDNIDWSENGFIYIQEDNGKKDRPFFGSRSREESSIWQLDPETGNVQRIARMNRSVLLPVGTTDRLPDIIGKWESSGILDVTNLLRHRLGNDSYSRPSKLILFEMGLFKKTTLVKVDN